jgi:hypothetical protein
MPAKPLPMISTSTLGWLMYCDLHILSHFDHAGTLLGHAVDGHQAFVTDAHAAERPPGLAAHVAFLEHLESGRRQSRQHCLARGGGNGAAVDQDIEHWLAVYAGDAQVSSFFFQEGLMVSFFKRLLYSFGQSFSTKKKLRTLKNSPRLLELSCAHADTHFIGKLNVLQSVAI